MPRQDFVWRLAAPLLAMGVGAASLLAGLGIVKSALLLPAKSFSGGSGAAVFAALLAPVGIVAALLARPRNRSFCIKLATAPHASPEDLGSALASIEAAAAAASRTGKVDIVVRPGSSHAELVYIGREEGFRIIKRALSSMKGVHVESCSGCCKVVPDTPSELRRVVAEILLEALAQQAQVVVVDFTGVAAELDLPPGAAYANLSGLLYRDVKLEKLREALRSCGRGCTLILVDPTSPAYVDVAGGSGAERCVAVMLSDVEGLNHLQPCRGRDKAIKLSGDRSKNYNWRFTPP
ncbi:MAG: hypothetical protein ABWW70_02660 [Thermoproteota archaeon]